jgi:hypothetical protein
MALLPLLERSHHGWPEVRRSTPRRGSGEGGRRRREEQDWQPGHQELSCGHRNGHSQEAERTVRSLSREHQEEEMEEYNINQEEE